MLDVDKEFSMKLEESVKPLVQKLLPLWEEPNNPLHSKAHIEQQILDSLTNRLARERFDLGFAALANNLKEVATPQQIEQIETEWKQIPENIKKNREAIAPEELHTIPLKDILGLSNHSIELIYKCGMDYFKKELYKDSSDIFFVLTYLISNNPEIWTAYGLASWRDQQKVEALHAFEKAAEHAKKQVLPLIYCAQCCADLKMPTEALDNLTKADEVLEAFPEANHSEYHQIIEKLKVEYQKMAA